MRPGRVSPRTTRAATRLQVVSRAVAIASLVAAGACNAIVGFEDDYRYDPQGSADAGGTDFATPDGGTSAQPDSSNAVIDGSTTPDASSPDADAGVLLKCTDQYPNAVFCDDFDTVRNDAGTFGWNELEIQPPASLTQELSGAGRALRAQVAANGSVKLWRTIEGGFATKNTLRFRARMKVSVSANVQYAAFAVIRFNKNATDTTYYGVASYMNAGCPTEPCAFRTIPTFSHLIDYEKFDGAVFLNEVQSHDVVISVTKTGTQYVGNVLWDGKDLDVKPAAADAGLPVPTPLSPVEVGIGVLYTDTDDPNDFAANVIIDDVVVERE